MKKLLILLALGWTWEGTCEPAPSSQNFEPPRKRADGRPLGIDTFQVPVLKPEILRKVPHDPQCFTQGLCFDQQGRAYESNGGLGRSSVRRFDPRSGQVLQESRLGREYWAEGLCPVGAELLLLTWQNRRFFFLDAEQLQPARSVEFFGSEGWGVAPSGEQVVLSDGSSRLQFFQPQPWTAAATVEVRESGRPVDLLNELEMVEGQLYANVWLSDYIAILNPSTGQVRAWLDCRGLLTPTEAEHADVLNGIAYDAGRRELYLTGKLWPWLFVVRPPADSALGQTP